MGRSGFAFVPKRGAWREAVGGLIGASLLAILLASCSVTLSLGTSETTGDQTAVATSGSSSGGGSSGVKKVFVTLTTNGGVGGVAGADAFCATDGNKPDSGSYKALVVNPGERVACTTANCSGGPAEHTGWILQPNTTYYKSDGTTPALVTDANGLISTIQNPLASVSTPVWTGLQMNWTVLGGSTCTGWTDGSGGSSGRYGNANQTGASSLVSQTQTVCATLHALLCFEQ